MKGQIQAPLTGRVRQKQRTRSALLEAARQLIAEGKAPTVAASAERALVSEATAYRYYPNARSLMQEALVVNLPDFLKVLQQIRSLPTLEERAKLAAESMARSVLSNETQVRAIISLSYSFRQSGEIDSPGELRPAFRVPLIDAVLEAAPARIGNKRRKDLRLALSVAISGEAVLSLKDFDCTDQEIIGTLGRAAYQLAAAGLQK
jgi:AcrR family transcriptional regulator